MTFLSVCEFVRLFEPHNEKTCLPVSDQGKTRSHLLSHRIARVLKTEGTILSKK